MSGSLLILQRQSYERADAMDLTLRKRMCCVLMLVYVLGHVFIHSLINTQLMRRDGNSSSHHLYECSFHDRQFSWEALTKEAYAIQMSLKKLAYCLENSSCLLENV